MATQNDFFTQLCLKFGWEPTPWRLDVFNFWAGQESTVLFDRAFNPLATTRQGSNLRYDLSYNNGNGPGNWNSVPVKVYADFESGVQATYETLQLGYYVNIRRCFTDQTGYQEAVAPYDFVSWVGSEEYGQRVVDHMRQSAASKTLATPVVVYDQATLAAIVEAFGGPQALKDWNKAGNALFLGYAIEQAKAVKLTDLVVQLVGQRETAAIRAVRDALTKALLSQVP